MRVLNMNRILTLRILRKMRCEKIPIRLGRNAFLYSPRTKKKEGWTIILHNNLFKDFSEDIRRIGEMLNLNFKVLSNSDYIEVTESRELIQ